MPNPRDFLPPPPWEGPPLPRYIVEPSLLTYQDRMLTPQELREMKLDIRNEKLAVDAIEKLHYHFVYEKRFRPWNYNDEQIRTGLASIFFWLVRDVGESGFGALNILHKVILLKTDEEVVHKNIYRDFLGHFHYMKDRWLSSLLTGEEVDLT